MQTGVQKSNFPPHLLSTLGTVHESHKQDKHFKVFSTLQQYLLSIEQIRIIDQLMRPTQKAQKQQILKRLNAILLEIKQQLDQINSICKIFAGKQQLFIHGQLIGINEWKLQIRKIDKLMNVLFDHINQNFTVISTVYKFQTKIFNVGAKQWRRKCLFILSDPSCMCIKA